MMVKSIYLNALQNEEHAGFCTYVGNYLDESDLKALKLEMQTAIFKEKLGVEKSVLDLVQKNSYTKTLEEADKKRDHLIKGFFKLVHGMEHHFQSSIAKAAYNINLINQRFRDITTLSYEKQTQAEESLLLALKEASEDVKKLGVTEWVTEIEKAHNAFLQLVVKRNVETDSRPDINMRTARLSTDETYNALVTRINAFITIDGQSGPYTQLVTQINGRIDQYMTIVAKHKSRNKSGETPLPTDTMT